VAFPISAFGFLNQDCPISDSLWLLFDVNFGPRLHKLDALLIHSFFDFFRDLHGAELRTAHAAEVRQLGAVLRKRFIVEIFGAS
jgi:hypothetical protein